VKQLIQVNTTFNSNGGQKGKYKVEVLVWQSDDGEEVKKPRQSCKQHRRIHKTCTEAIVGEDGMSH
jgi:hypothetical protein